MVIPRRVLLPLAVVIVVAGGVAMWRSCAQSERDRIIAVIHEGRDAIERESVRGAMVLVSPGYHDNLGFDYEQARLMLQQFFFSVDELRVELSGLSVPAPELSDSNQRATVEIDVAVSGSWQGQALYFMGSHTQPRHLTVRLIKQDRHWLIDEISGLEIPSLE